MPESTLECGVEGDVWANQDIWTPSSLAVKLSELVTFCHKTFSNIVLSKKRSIIIVRILQCSCTCPLFCCMFPKIKLEDQTFETNDEVKYLIIDFVDQWVLILVANAAKLIITQSSKICVSSLHNLVTPISLSLLHAIACNLFEFLNSLCLAAILLPLPLIFTDLLLNHFFLL